MKSSTDPYPTDPIQTHIAAQILGVSRRNVWRWVIQGHIRGWRKGGCWMVSKAEILSDWNLKKNPTHPEAIAWAKLKATPPPARAI